METTSTRVKTINFVLKAIATAMGVAVIVLQTLGATAPSTLITLMGIGLFALALAVLQND